MSLNGTVTPSPNPSAAITELIKAWQGAGTPGNRDGLIPDGRKKLTTAAGINGPAGPMPHPATDSGLVVGVAAPAATALSQLPTSRSPRTVFALMGRFR